MPLDRRLTDELQREAARIEPNVERHLWAVERRARQRGGISPSAVLVAAAIVVAAVVLRIPDPRSNAPGGVQVSSPPAASSPSPPAPTAGSPSTAPSYPQIAGTYVATLDAAVAAVKRDGVEGTWTMRLQPDGGIFLSPPASFVPGASGLSGIAFSLAGDRLRTNLFYNDYCDSIGTYAWAIAGGRLRLTPVDETCPIRQTLLATTPWVAGR